MVKYKPFILLTILVIIALTIRLSAFSMSDNGWGADPDERIRTTARWLNMEGPRPIFPGDLWLPLHYYLIALSIKIFGNIPLGPRILHLIFGILTIFPFYGLVRLVFNERVALISTLIFIFYPVHILCSVVTLSEGPFLFFLIASLYYFFKNREDKKARSLFLCCAFLIMASVVRYEAWLFIAIIPALLFFDRRFKDGLVFLCIASILPILWLSPVTQAYRHIVFMATKVSKGEYRLDNLIYWFKVIIKYLSLPLAVSLILGIFRSIKTKRELSLLIFPLSLLIFFTYGVFTFKLLKNIEFSLSFTVLFIPFAVFGFDRLLDKNIFVKLTVGVLLFFTVIWMTSETFKLIDGCRYKVYVKEVGDYLKHNTDKDTKILLENYEWQANHIPIYMGTDIDRFAICGRGGDMELRKKETVELYIKEQRPEYIIRSDWKGLAGFFNEHLSKPNADLSLALVFESGPYRIYHVNYRD